MAKVFAVFNVSRLSICNQLYPNLDVKMVRGVGKKRPSVAGHPGGRARKVCRGDGEMVWESNGRW